MRRKLTGLNLCELMKLRYVAKLIDDTLVGGRAWHDEVTGASRLSPAERNAKGDGAEIPTDIRLVAFGARGHITSRGGGDGLRDAVALALPGEVTGRLRVRPSH
jgi:hypothetical protein